MAGIEKVQKRNGMLVVFNQFKITNAIFKALKATNCRDRTLAEELSSYVIEQLENIGGAT